MHAEIWIAAVCWLGQLPPTSAPSDTAPGITAESIEVRYARAQVQLAEANLKRVQQSNKQTPRSVSGSVVAEYQDDVRVARIRLKQATAGRAAAFQVGLQRAEAERRTAEMAWKKATAANERATGTFSAIDIERFRLRAEVAKLQLERGLALVDSGREAQLQWEVDMLHNQVQRLQEESRGPTSLILRYYYPDWLW